MRWRALTPTLPPPEKPLAPQSPPPLHRSAYHQMLYPPTCPPTPQLPVLLTPLMSAVSSIQLISCNPNLLLGNLLIFVIIIIVIIIILFSNFICGLKEPLISYCFWVATLLYSMIRQPLVSWENHHWKAARSFRTLDYRCFSDGRAEVTEKTCEVPVRQRRTQMNSFQM